MYALLNLWLQMQARLETLRERARGQGLVEYALILALVAIAVVIILGNLGGAIKDIFSAIIETLKQYPT